MYMKEGQIKFLQEDLQRRMKEVAQLHQEKMQEETQVHSTKEKTLKAEVERLLVEIQFKNQEIHRLREKCLENRPSTSSTDNSASVVAGASSPKVRRVFVDRFPQHPSTPQKIKEEKSALISSPQKPSKLLYSLCVAYYVVAVQLVSH